MVAAIIVIIIVSIYVISMIIYFTKRKLQGLPLIENECSQCKNKGKKLIKYYYKQKKKENRKPII